MAISTDAIVLTMTNPDTGEYLTANVYMVDGVYEPDGVTLRRLSIGQLVMALCLQRAAKVEGTIISTMATIDDTSAQLEAMTEIENAILNDDVNMSSKKVRYNGNEYTYYTFLSEIMALESVPPGIANSESEDLLTSIESKMDELNSFSQKTMIELQSLTNKRDQSYDMVSNILKSLNGVLVGVANNI